MSKKIMKLCALALALSLAVCGCGTDSGDETPEDGEAGLSWSEAGKVVQDAYIADEVFSLNYDSSAPINPIAASSATNMAFWSLLYDSVFTLDENLRCSSEVVTEVTTEDYVWWVFKVDTSIPFTDGSTLSARDVAYSIQRAKQSPYYAQRLSCIYGCSAFDDESFAITTQYPQSQLTSLLNIPIIKDGSNGEDVPPGSGPYRLSDDGGALVLFDENRHASQMPVDKIYLKEFDDVTGKITAFEDSVIDLVTNDPTGVFNLGYGSSNETRYYTTTNLHYLGFNMTSLFFSNPQRRYAMMYAVDRDGFVKDTLNGCGVATALPLWPSSELYDGKYAETFDFRPEACGSMMDATGIADHDSDGEPEFMYSGIVVELNLKFIVNNDSSAKVEHARKITQTLNDLGIKTTLYELGWNDYITALEDGDYDMYYGEIRLTPDWNIMYLFEEDGAQNYAQCMDPQYAELYLAYLASPEETRYDSYQAACRYVIENGAVVPIAFERCEVLTHRGVAVGISPTQYDVFNRFEGWTINLTKPKEDAK